MKNTIKKIALAASLILSTGAVSAATVTVLPGGSFSASGTATFRIAWGSSASWSGSCAASFNGTLNPSDASFTLTNATFDYPCGTINGNPVVASIGIPWSGPVHYATANGAFYDRLSMTAYLSQASGPGPIWVADCSASTPLLSVQWKSNGLPGSAATSITTNGYKAFATTLPARSCEISFDMFLVPFQTFTQH